MIAPKIEPEIVVRLASPLPAGLTDPVEVLRHVEWLALGFEVIDPPTWTASSSRPTSSPPTACTRRWSSANRCARRPTRSPTLAEQLAAFAVTLSKADAVAAQGGGKNVLRSPALCLAELASARERQGLPPLGAGALVSTGTLTESQPIAAGERWSARADGPADRRRWP